MTGAPDRAPLRLARVALAIAVGLLFFKIYAAWLTGSRAVLSDAMESVVNVVASAAMLLAIRVARRPADTEHPFGHGKVELLAAAFEGSLLIIAGLAIAWESAPALLNPRPIEHLGWGSAVVGVTATIHAGLGLVLLRAGRRHHSPALKADGRHLLTDALSTLGVLGALGLVALTHVTWIDPAAACAVATWVTYTGARVVVDTARSLLDTHRPEHARRIADALSHAHPPGLLDPHDLRIVDAESTVFVILHVRAPAHWSVGRTNRLRVEARAAIADTFGVPADVNLQIEPCTPRCCPACSEPECPTRSAAFRALVAPDPAAICSPHPAPGHEHEAGPGSPASDDPLYEDIASADSGSARTASKSADTDGASA